VPIWCQSRPPARRTIAGTGDLVLILDRHMPRARLNRGIGDGRTWKLSEKGNASTRGRMSGRRDREAARRRHEGCRTRPGALHIELAARLQAERHQTGPRPTWSGRSVTGLPDRQHRYTCAYVLRRQEVARASCCSIEALKALSGDAPGRAARPYPEWLPTHVGASTARPAGRQPASSADERYAMNL